MCMYVCAVVPCLGLATAKEEVFYHVKCRRQEDRKQD